MPLTNARNYSAVPGTRLIMSKPKIHADYLVVGAGTAGMSFVDTILTEDAGATVILVDRNPAPGGHWTTAYPHVRLHQPSCFYGVNSLELGRNRDKRGRERYDIHDRATGKEVAEYYARVADQFRRSGRVRLCLGHEHSERDGQHVLTDVETGEVTPATCRKIVTVRSQVVVPSMRGPPFPVDPAVRFVPCNDLPEIVQTSRHGKYVVIGAGKTGMDSVTHLLRSGVDPSAVTWIVSRDVWVILREGIQREGDNHYKDMSRFMSPTLRCALLKEAWREYEKDGLVARIDLGRPEPAVFKGATIDNAELAGLRTVKDVVRLGRVTSIRSDAIELEQGSIQLLSPSDTLIVDCMADMDRTFYGYTYDEFKFFEEGRINLGPTPVLFNPSFGSAIIAYIEATFSDDMDKNSLLFVPPKFNHEDLTFDLLFSFLYSQCKTMAALARHKPSSRLILESRLNPDAPLHHGGMRPFLWGMFGPLGIAKKGDLFVKKVEAGGFGEVQDCFGSKGRKLPARSDFVMKEKGKKKAKSNYPPAKTKSHPKRNKRINCCSTVNVVQ